VSDALHMTPLCSIGAGDLPTALRYAQQRVQLPFYREDRHLVANWLVVVAALDGRFDEAVALADEMRAGWVRGGRLPLGGFAVAPAAAAMVHGIRGDDAARQEWLDILEEMRRVVATLVGRRSGYGPLFSAITALHHGDAAAAVGLLEEGPEELDQWHTSVWRQWYAATWAEGAVLAGRADASERLERSRPIVVDNPIATAMLDRAAAVAGGDGDALLAAAAALAAAACPYQQARTLVLAGDESGQAMLRAMGAAPMGV
jgi:hypothetical protein